MAYPTAATVISKAARELGLVSADLVDPFGSSDTNILQLCALLEALGQDLCEEHPWAVLQRSHTLSTADGVAAYDFPSDFDRLADGSEWNRTQQWPLTPVSPQQWQTLKARSESGTVFQLFRVAVQTGSDGSQLVIHPTPTSVETLAFEYLSTSWVDPTGAGGTPSSGEVTDADDVLYFKQRLLITGLKSRFSRAKGLPSGAVDAEFADALDRAKGGDGAAPVLSLSRGSPANFRFIDGLNVPDQGLGE